jgi:hypothetical protein
MKHIFPLILLFFTVMGCQSKIASNDGVLIDIRKTCSEYPRLVEKIMAFRERSFDISSDKDSRLANNETWDLKKAVAKRYKLGWFQLKYENDKLKSLWFGPRTDLEQDLKLLGMITFDLLDKKGQRLDAFERPTYYSKDFNDRTIKIEYDAPHSEGVTITCY